MSDNKTFLETIAALRAYYADDLDSLESIDRDEKLYIEKVQMREFAQHPTVELFLKIARQEVIAARKRLATELHLSEDTPEAKRLRDKMWFIIASRLWFIEKVSEDFDSQIAQLESEMRSELEKKE